MIRLESLLILMPVLVGGSSVVAVHAARSFALRRALLDHPNERSSHKLPVPRLGGAAFVPLVLITLGGGWLIGLGNLWTPAIGAYFAGAVTLYLISLVDDFRPLPTWLRFGFHFIAAAGIVITTLPTVTEGLALSSGLRILLIATFIVWIVGSLNIYNFMDGIDGIAGVQAIAAGLGWLAIGLSTEAPFVTLLGIGFAAGAAGFLTLNWPPAKIFMGDAGSTVLGFSFAVAPLLAREETPLVDLLRLFAGAVLSLWPFLADGTFTILRRLQKRENILKAHRSHLYQRLVIAGKSHLHVTIIYGTLSLAGAGLAWGVIAGLTVAEWLAVLFPPIAFLGLWCWTRVCERSKEAP